jgi:hypothetical protein
MKKSMLVMLLLSCFTVKAANHDTQLVKDSYKASMELQDSVRMIEDHFSVTCGDGKISLALFNAKFPQVATWKGLCQSSTTKLILKVKSSFDLKDNKVSFRRKSIALKNLISIGSESDPNDGEKYIDPLLNAFRRSEIVKDIKRLTEDSLRLTCDAGKARRGVGLYAAKYTYKTSCRSENTEVRLKLHSKIQLTSDTSFRFNLKDFKICFK